MNRRTFLTTTVSTAAASLLVPTSSQAALDLTQAALPYAPEAMEPHIDAVTMGIHHGKHHAAYVNNYNKAIEQLAEAQVCHSFPLISAFSYRRFL